MLIKIPYKNSPHLIDFKNNKNSDNDSKKIKNKRKIILNFELALVKSIKIVFINS